MTPTAVRVSRRTPLPSPAQWFGMVGMPGGATPGCDMATSSVYYNGNTYFGYIDAAGAIRVGKFNHTSHAVTVSPAIATGFTVDLHTGPGVLVRSSDHKILVAYCQQATNHMYIALSTNAEDVSAWGAPTDIASTLAGGGQYTYACLIQLSGESGKIHLYYRDGLDAVGKLCYSTSTDGGGTWTAQTVLFSNANGSFWAIDTNESSRVDFAITDGSASEGNTASVYHFYYSGGNYFKTDGTQITAALPLGTSNVTKAYDGATNGSAIIPYAILGSGGPYILVAAGNTAGWSTHNENYWYGVYTGGAWSFHQIVDSGAIPNNSLFEGGLALDVIDPTKVYVAHATSGFHYQIFLYQTTDGGSTWSSTQLTSDTDQPNWHPQAPRNANSGLRCWWKYGSIAPDTGPQNFTVQIRGYPNPEGPF